MANETVIYRDNEGNPIPIVAVDIGTNQYALATAQVGSTGEVLGLNVYTVDITTDDTPDYSIGDSIGTGFEIELTTGAQPIKLSSLVVIDEAGQAPALTIYLLNVAPTAAQVDNDAFAWKGASGIDVLNVVSTVVIGSSDYDTTNGKSVVNRSNINQDINPIGGTLYGLIVAKSAYNAASTSDLRLRFGVNPE